MKTSLLFGLIISLFNSCNSLPGFKGTTNQEKKDALNRVDFDKNIIGNLEKYEGLKDILAANLDTLMNYRNSKNFVSYVDTGSKIDSTVLRNEDCYWFSEFSLRDNAIPDFLKNDIKKAWEAIGYKGIQGFTICNYSTILSQKKCNTISIKVFEEGGENRLYIDHVLSWNGGDFDSRIVAYNFSRDTVLKNNCIYRMVIREEVPL